jgi:hypothetical protein
VKRVVGIKLNEDALGLHARTKTCGSGGTGPGSRNRIASRDVAITWELESAGRP